MDWSLVAEIWLFGTIVSAGLSALGVFAMLMTLAESRRPADRRDAARYVLQALGGLVLSPAWFVIVPLLAVFGVNKLFEIGGVPTPLEMWRERQAAREKAERKLGQERDIERKRLAKRVKELEDELEIERAS